MKKILILFLLFFFLSINTYAHKINFVNIKINFKPDGTFHITALLHIPHLLSTTEPFNFKKYNDKYEELIAISNEQFIEVLKKNKLKILNKFNFSFDGNIPEKTITFKLKDRKPIELLFVGHEKSYHVKEAFCQINITGKYPLFTKILTWENHWKNKKHFINIAMGEKIHLAPQFVEPENKKDILLKNLPASTWDVFKEFTFQGFIHIIPKGFDHILFVLCLFLSFITWPSLLKQVTTFTIAHSITLGLCVYGLISLPATIIEPLIALSIIVIAIENYVKKEIGHSRLYIVFGFGLMHGLGFAGVIKEMQLPADLRLSSLFSFNIGVELGQITVILTAWLLIGAWFRKKDWYHSKLVKPTSFIIAACATYLLVDRLPIF
ncbi:MAG: hypothetical protein COA79_16260 [Planctomycetota bacterium]|nr:MAG: hypothetical protein COA79_16260 [Planctomycetota bacterium]